MRSLRLRLARVFARPASRAGTAMLTCAALMGAFAIAAGVGYTASRPLLGDGCAFLGKGHTVAHVCGETGRSDAEIAQQLATGKEELQTVRLPDGRLAVVNQTTGTLSYFDSATLTPTSPPASQPESAGKLEPVPTKTDGYLVDSARKVVEQIAPPAQPAPAPVTIPDGIKAVVPGGDSLWVMTPKAEVVEVADGKVVRTIRLGVTPAGITVADGHPVVVAEDGATYAVDGAKPKLLGNVGLSGQSLVLASWRGAGRYVVAVDRGTGRVGVLDPRTGHHTTVQLKFTAGRTQLDAPVMLGERVYVPDRSGPSLWRINVPKGAVDEKPLEVPGVPGPITVTVESGHVWAHSQYDRRVLVIDANGQHHTADKGPRPELGDVTGQTGPPGAGVGTGQPGQSGDAPPEGPPGTTTGPMVIVPGFAARTPYRQACEEIKKLKLICRAVAGGDQAGLRTGDVLGTDPPAGTQVPEGSRVIVRYAGPLKTPSVRGLWHEEACRQIKAAKLTCAPTIDPSPALSPSLLGMVSDQSPDPQDQIATGKAVSYTYPDSIALPNLADQASGAACEQITRVYRMRCTAIQGDPPARGKQPGQVYEQSPAAGSVAKIGTTISIRYYRGTSTVPSVIGQHIDAACAEVQRLGFVCRRQEGVTAWGTGHAVGEVYEQSHAPGTELAVGTAITLTYYSGNQDLPNYVGTNPAAACADMNARGFQCQQATQPYRTQNVVEAQSRPAGRYPFGTAIAVYYNPWPLTDWWIVPYGGGWRMQAGSGEHRIGFGYPANATFNSGGLTVYQYRCPTGQPGACRGYGHSVFYSRIVPPGTGYVDPDFTEQKAFTVFAACTSAAGQRWVWRTWHGDASRRSYRLVHTDNANAPGGAVGSELLGCIWW
ncbi:PASTA domain-containing protein [Allorhizocola rhizosphaerae]|uniref:PASTA domain-containing protein n=1 Tax=Allorhizocola rhizosphaerae TaxID=1872709 RepID=UPI0013C2A5F4|nr:PASTA domain-containing protein [Allorhizocola rhizosphaerae]